MPHDKVTMQLRKGLLEYCVLLLLRRAPAYAADILTSLEQYGLLVVEGTLYPLLTRMKNDALLSYQWQESTQGPPRKYYRLTPEGEQQLLTLDHAWKALTLTVERLKEKPAPTPTPAAATTEPADQAGNSL